ncbi:MAG: hypothetical protein ACI8VC_002406 [Candidatus Endobugula sp.]|jgi:hypothetical protein
MDTTKKIKSFVILETILLISHLIFSFSLEQSLPLSLQNYLHLQSQSEISTADLVIIWGGIPVLLAYIVSVVGLLLTKVWAKNLYLFVSMAGYALAPFLGPTVEHAMSATIYDLGTLTGGVVLALLFFTRSSFDKSM